MKHIADLEHAKCRKCGKGDMRWDAIQHHSVGMVIGMRRCAVETCELFMVPQTIDYVLAFDGVINRADVGEFTAYDASPEGTRK